MAAQKWAALARRVGRQYAAMVREQPTVESLWYSTEDDGVELWLVTAPSNIATTRRLWARTGSLLNQFPDADIRLHVLNRRNYPSVNLDVMLPEGARLITRFANAG